MISRSTIKTRKWTEVLLNSENHQLSILSRLDSALITICPPKNLTEYKGP
jgi:hypothetical protein